VPQQGHPEVGERRQGPGRQQGAAQRGRSQGWGTVARTAGRESRSDGDL
jgi:hypothetical protein